MLSNLAGGAAHALGGVHADADGLLHEDLLQPGAHGNQPAGGYFNSAVLKAMREMVEKANLLVPSVRSRTAKSSAKRSISTLLPLLTRSKNYSATIDSMLLLVLLTLPATKMFLKSCLNKCTRLS